MLYIHQTTCISPQQTFLQPDINVLHEPVDQKLKVIEPAYENIPPGALRRMGKTVRLGVGAALPLLKDNIIPDGFIIGTANGGMEDCIKFLNQIIEYDEGVLTPGNFVQSTPNAIAGQLALLTGNKNYNITHVSRGLAFENALIDAVMLLDENPGHTYLTGAVDDVSIYNYIIDHLAGWFKQEHISSSNFYGNDTPGSMAGEGAAMFMVNGNKENAVAAVKGISTLHSQDTETILQHLQTFLEKYLPAGEKIDLFLSGENGDNRCIQHYTAVENLLEKDVTIARFKHMTGEYATATAIAFWLACHIIQVQELPLHMIKMKGNKKEYNNILIYNNHKGIQNSFILLTH